VTVIVAVVLGSKVVGFTVNVFSTLLTFTVAIVTCFVPVFFIVTLKEAPDVPDGKLTLVIVIEDDPMNPIVRAPIHAATAMLTATVTAISMIDATTGLRAFLHFNIFIFLYIPPSGLLCNLEETVNLNLTT
jgi:hypothetical protein